MKAIDRLEQLLSFISGASLSVLAAGVFLQVVMRYVFSYTPFWSEEAFRILLVALQWPMSYLIVAVPLGFAAAAVFLLVRMWAQRQARRLA